MFTTTRSFQQTWEQETMTTRRVLEALTEEGLSYRPHPRSRTAGELGWHIVTAPLWFANEVLKLGVQVDVPKAAPARAADLATAHGAIADKCGDAVVARGDSWLPKETDFFGRKLTHGGILAVMLSHEIHHRGQLSVYLRPMGVKVPSIYGPSGDT